ncbi:MAG: cysteine synthase A [Clostridia bacterium]|nr:cysteine synthase A [Clostridia bacterium]
MHSKFNLGLGIDKNGRIANNLTELVGNTPMLSLSGYSKKHGIASDLVAKLEYFNPLGSAKDRVGVALIEDAEKSGEINKDTVIIEPTSGNTGVGLSFAAAIKGYKIILTMPENMSKERILLLRALGAQVILTPEKEGMQGAIDKATSLKEELGNAYIPDQFSNPSNSSIHRKTTGPEILRDTYGKIDYFVAGVGTGGTITGIGEVLKAYNKDIKIIAVEPSSSAVLSGEEKGTHGLMGIGAGFVPSILNTEIIDEIVTVTEEEAYEAARTVAKTDGLLVGISSGAALFAATEIAKKNNNKNIRIVVLLPDSGERYLSTALFE